MVRRVDLAITAALIASVAACGGEDGTPEDLQAPPAATGPSDGTAQEGVPGTSVPGGSTSGAESPTNAANTPTQSALPTPTNGAVPTGPATPVSGEETPALPTPQSGETAEPDEPMVDMTMPGTSEEDGIGPTPDVEEPAVTPAEEGPSTEPPDTMEETPPDMSEAPPASFSGPEGTIPNERQPASVVNANQSSWREGLVSPSLLEGHQINQPAVINGYMLIAGNEDFWFYDVSDPTSPKELSKFSTPNRRQGGEAESHTVSFARRGDDYFLATVSGTGIDTWDVTDVRNPQHLGHMGINGVNYGDYTEAVWGVAWQGQYIYVGATNNGVKVVDASNPSSLSLAGEISPSQYGGVSAGPVEAVGNVLVVMTPKESGGIATLDISDPTNPTRLASLSANKSYIGQFYRRYAFLISPLRAWDVLSDPRNIGSGNSPIGQANHGGAEYLSFSDDKLFLGMVRAEIGGTPGTDIFDISDVNRMREIRHVWGRQDRNGLNDDQFNIAFGNLVVMGDDQSPYAGWVIGAFAEEPDMIPPEVDTVIPKDQETVPASSRVGVSFSDNIELATVNSASFIVRPVGGQPLSGTYGSRMGVLNFDPDEELQPGTYEVVLPAGGVTDLVGNALTTEWKSTFTVQ